MLRSLVCKEQPSVQLPRPTDKGKLTVFAVPEPCCAMGDPWFRVWGVGLRVIELHAYPGQAERLHTCGQPAGQSRWTLLYALLPAAQPSQVLLQENLLEPAKPKPPKPPKPRNLNLVVLWGSGCGAAPSQPRRRGPQGLPGSSTQAAGGGRPGQPDPAGLPAAGRPGAQLPASFLPVRGLPGRWSQYVEGNGAQHGACTGLNA